MWDKKENLLIEVNRLKNRYELSKSVPEDYYEPGMMEYLEQNYGAYDENTGEIIIRFEVKGTRYEGRTELIESVNLGDRVLIERDATNSYNMNNFVCLTMNSKVLGYVPEELCNVLAPLYDEDDLVFKEATISFVEPISKRSRYAKQAILFVELRAKI